MKILHFHYGTDGGAERFFVNLATALHARGVEQEFFVRPDRSWKSDIDKLGKVHEGYIRPLSLSWLFLPGRIRRIVKTFQPDVMMGWRPRVIRLMKNYPHILRVGRLGDYPTKLGAFASADRMIVNTPGVAERFVNLGWTKPIDVVSNFTRVKPCAPIAREKLSTRHDAFVVVAVGRFVKIKGYDMLIRALARLPGVILWLVGDGEERAALEKLAGELGVIDRIRFTGWQADPAPFLAGGDVVAISSSHETLGNVILEGWSMGLPVVSTRAKGPRWLITEGEDGLLVDIGDDAQFAAAIDQLRESARLRDHLTSGGRRTLEQRFTVDAVTTAYLDVLERGIKEHSKKCGGGTR
ncbi:glycosyltransferase [Shinella zoogloeoides]|uniref:glycosyltransferase n=1 Tax=Shinella zoogloeoides TaxID=352475 RepID=UPI0028B18552|nr:glycosyltransferase [Shinella zoogloeoides]